MDLMSVLLESALTPVLLSVLVACFPVILLNRFFIRQNSRYWLGMSHGTNSWQEAGKKLALHITYRRKDVERSLIQAGIYDTRLAAVYFPAKIVVAGLFFLVVYLFGEQLGFAEHNQKIAIAFVGMVMVILLPDMWLHRRQKKRIRKISSELPYVCDLMAVCVQTGMTIEASIAYLGDELKGFDKDLAYVMKRVDSVAKISGIQQALDELGNLFPTNQIKSFVYTLGQSLQYGSSIFDVLTRLSANLREVEMLELEEKVGKLSAKMSVPLILFIMFPIVILITAPGIMRMMSNG